MCRSETQCSNPTPSNLPTGAATPPPPARPSSTPADPPGHGGGSSGGPGGAHDGSALPADSSERWIVFRESFLFYLDPAKREVLRRAGEEVFGQMLSGDLYRPEEPWTHARLRALALDLRWAAQFLAEVAEEPLHSHPEDADENRLAREAFGWSEEVERVAQLILAAIEGPVR